MGTTQADGFTRISGMKWSLFMGGLLLQVIIQFV
jgi:roadblock/LC7 domain-containing protein